MSHIETFVYMTCGRRNVMLAENGGLTLSHLNLSHFKLVILSNTGDYALIGSNGKHFTANGLPTSEERIWNLYDVNDGVKFISATGNLTIDGENVFQVKKYSFAARLGMVHWGGDVRLTNEDYLCEGAEKVRKLGITTFKIYAGRKSDQTYFTAYKRRHLHEIVQQENYRHVFGMEFKRIIIVCHYNTASYWKRLSEEDARTEMAKERDELMKMAKELGNYPDTEFIISNWEGDCIINVDKQPHIYTRMVEWINSRQHAIESAGCSNVHHAIEVNFVKQSLFGHPSVTTEVLPHTRTDYVSYSCYDAANEEEADACVQLILRNAKGRPLYFGEFGTPVNVRSTEQSWTYLRGIINVMEKYSIGLGCYWQLYDNEYDTASTDSIPVECTQDSTVIVNGCTAKRCRGFGIVNPGRKCTGIWGIISGLW